MKNIFLILLVVLSLNCKSQTINKTWSKINDDTKHYYAGFLITSITGEVVLRKTGKVGLSIGTGFLAGVVAGIAKEAIYDGMMKKGVVNNWDAFHTGWGAIGGAIGLTISIDMESKIRVENEEKFKNLQIRLKEKEEIFKNLE